jgi:hypothetical protein
MLNLSSESLSVSMRTRTPSVVLAVLSNSSHLIPSHTAPLLQELLELFRGEDLLYCQLSVHLML